MKNFFDFIKRSPTSFHATESIRQRLLGEGYTELFEDSSWELKDGGKYFTVRHGSALIAFRTVKAPCGFMIVASHSDSPSFKVKKSIELSGTYTRVPTETYGGMIMYSWLDRPLSIAGRLVIRTENGIRTVLVDLDSDVLTIPSIAIHFNRSVNEGYKFNPAKDTIPLAAISSEAGELRSRLADAAGVRADDIVDHDLFVYVREEPKTVGLSDELILSPRLDDLECVYASTEAFLSAKESESVPVLVVYDSEEVGSATVSGADSTFLTDVLKRISGTDERMIALLGSSVVVSADNAHAIHPNAPELSDVGNSPVLGGGVVIKYNSNKRYATDGVSAAVFSEICKRAGAATQSFYNRADMPGGSTLGKILNTQISVMTVDVGLPQLAMHSAVETASVSDLITMEKALTEFFSSSVRVSGNEIVIN